MLRINPLIDESVQKSIIFSETGQTGGVVLHSINTEGTKFMYIFFSSLTTSGSNLKQKVDQLKLKNRRTFIIFISLGTRVKDH